MTSTLIGQAARGHRRTRTRTEYYPFEMGLNLVDPVMELKPGVMIDGENYEVHYRRGYRRIDGYERYDGTGKPSDENYSILPYTPNSNVVSSATEMDNTGIGGDWINNGLTITADALDDPAGTTQAEKLEEEEPSGPNPEDHSIEQGSLGAAASFNTAICYFKEGSGPNQVAKIFTRYGSGKRDSVVGIDLGSQEVQAENINLGPVRRFGADQVDDDWWRLYITVEATTVGGLIRIGIAKSVEALEEDYAPVSINLSHIFAWNSIVREGLEPEVGDTVTGGTSGATGVVLKKRIPYTDGDETETSRKLVLKNVSGTFESGEDLQIDSISIGVADSAQSNNDEAVHSLHNDYLQAVIESRRDTIAKVPGSGVVRGVWKYKGDIYAFRDDAGEGSCRMYKATTDGWEEQDMGVTVDFDNDAAIIPFNSGSAEPSENDTLTGATSGATGQFIGATLDSGSWSGGDAAGTMTLYNVTGTFDGTENIDNTTTSSTNIATNNDTPEDSIQQIFEEDTVQGSVSGATATVKRIITQSGTFSGGDAEGYLAIEETSGQLFDGEMMLSTKHVRVPFDSGSVKPSLGDVITGNSSGASGTLKEFTLDSGAWGDGDAAGTFVLEDFSGTFDGTENLNNTTENKDDIASNSDRPITAVAAVAAKPTQTKLATGGRFEFVNHNFFGHEKTRRMYGADGANHAFEWDGTTFVPIKTGMEDDKPEFIAAFKQHLFLSFSGGSLQFSSIGDPLNWTPVLGGGAGELAVGEEITGLEVEVGNVLAVFTRSETYMLYGDSSDNFELRRFHQGTGAIKYTVQKMGTTWFLDDEGILALSHAETHGDFNQATMTGHVQPLINSFVGPDASRKPQSSIRARKRNQYRIYLDDKTGVMITMENNRLKGLTKFRLAHQFNVTYSVKDDEESEGDEQETLLAGGDDGYVYYLDSGTSFDGEQVTAWFVPSYYHYRGPAYNKVYRGMVLDVDSEADTTATISLIPEYDYAAGPAALEQLLSIAPKGGRWNIDDWNDFAWSAPLFQQIRVRLDGWGRNFSFLIVTELTYDKPHIFQGVTVEYAPRRLVR